VWKLVKSVLDIIQESIAPSEGPETPKTEIIQLAFDGVIAAGDKFIQVSADGHQLLHPHRLPLAPGSHRPSQNRT
jgi:hypothetical protein